MDDRTTRWWVCLGLPSDSGERARLRKEYADKLRTHRQGAQDDPLSETKLDEAADRQQPHRHVGPLAAVDAPHLRAEADVERVDANALRARHAEVSELVDDDHAGERREAGERGRAERRRWRCADKFCRRVAAELGREAVDEVLFFFFSTRLKIQTRSTTVIQDIHTYRNSPIEHFHTHVLHIKKRFWNLKIVSDAWSVVSSRMCEIPFWEALAAALNPEGPEPTIAISNSSLIC